MTDTATPQPIRRQMLDRRRLTRYLDTLRMSAYFGLLYLLVRPAVVIDADQTPSLWSAVRVVGVVLYLIFDLAVRWVNRIQIVEHRKEQNRRPSDLSPVRSGLLLLVEIAGVGMLSVWACGLIAWKLPFTDEQQLGLALFLILASVHNAMHIHAYGTSLVEYFNTAVLDDAFEFRQVSAIWIGHLQEWQRRLEVRIRARMASQFRLGRLLDGLNPAPMGYTLLLLILRGAFHFFLQLCALHILLFNAILGGVLLLHVYLQGNPSCTWADLSQVVISRVGILFTGWRTIIALIIVVCAAVYVIKAARRQNCTSRKIAVQLLGNGSLIVIPFLAMFMLRWNEIWVHARVPACFNKWYIWPVIAFCSFVCFGFVSYLELERRRNKDSIVQYLDAAIALTGDQVVTALMSEWRERKDRDFAALGLALERDLGHVVNSLMFRGKQNEKRSAWEKGAQILGNVFLILGLFAAVLVLGWNDIWKLALALHILIIAAIVIGASLPERAQPAAAPPTTGQPQQDTAPA